MYKTAVEVIYTRPVLYMYIHVIWSGKLYYYITDGLLFEETKFHQFQQAEFEDNLLSMREICY